MTVNRELLNLYWELGREICEKQEKANSGEGLMAQLAKDLSAAFPGVKGFPTRNLLYIKKWYCFYCDFEIAPQFVTQIPWGHNREIIAKCSEFPRPYFTSGRPSKTIGHGPCWWPRLRVNCISIPDKLKGDLPSIEELEQELGESVMIG